jgi:hypothetical protein
MSYVNVVICVGSFPILETWPPIYRGQERTVRDRLRVSQSSPYVYFRYTPCLTDFTFEFVRRPTSPILSPSYWTFVELTLVTTSVGHTKRKGAILLYITATHQVVSTVLVVERSEEGKAHGVQRPVYFLSKVLSPLKQRYPHYQKLAYNMFTTARKLRQYFVVHPIIVVNEAPVSNI